MLGHIPNSRDIQLEATPGKLFLHNFAENHESFYMSFAPSEQREKQLSGFEGLILKRFENFEIILHDVAPSSLLKNIPAIIYDMKSNADGKSRFESCDFAIKFRKKFLSLLHEI